MSVLVLILLPATHLLPLLLPLALLLLLPRMLPAILPPIRAGVVPVAEGVALAAC